MKIGVNYLLESKELYEEGKIDFIDYFKLYGLNDDLSALNWCINNKGLMFHGMCAKTSFFGDSDLFEKTDVSTTKDIIKKSVAPYLSAHIFSNEERQLDEYYSIFKENIKKAEEMFDTKVVLENVPLRKRRMYGIDLIKPEVISKIVYDNDIDFLFDISHARTSAMFLDMTLEEYVSKLPMDRCIEVHLAGMFNYPDVSDENIRKNYSEKQIKIIEKLVEKYGLIYDYHGKMNEEDYKFLEYIVKTYPNIEYITLEYGSVNDYSEFNDSDFLYPICNYQNVNEKAKEEVLEQLIRIRDIVNK